MFGLTQQPNASRHVIGVCLTLLMLAAHIPVTQAALTIGATRVVFDSDKRSTSVIVANPSNRPFAVQTWVNTASDDDTTAVPFIPSPPLFRLNPGKEQQVQINGLPNKLPPDRESLFYFNVQEIPQAEANDGNVLNIALRTRIKLFYRPSQLKDNPIARLKDLQWSIKNVGGQPHLVVNNPTPFHVSFIRLDVTGNGQSHAVQNATMVEPLGNQSYPLNGFKPNNNLQVVFSAINDYGGYSTPLTQPIQLAP
ncbi:fimbrial biogenesis chaperone [Pseudomonas izuensis]|uniref:Molecular chaperone n=1 Tax=Pseudomonas izuensis TaxID=2684212 RepID=A0ABM7S197_9PSED|nr:molecular chaperone [Pseudomonas izuensis]BCX68052.1 molecular chaperone [Pseudomonas izuensis]